MSPSVTIRDSYTLCPGSYNDPVDIVDIGEMKRMPDGGVTGRHGRGVCSGCGKIRALNSRGHLRKHSFKDERQRTILLDVATWNDVWEAAARKGWRPEAWIGWAIYKGLNEDDPL